jgi:hypothetical protein
MNRSVREKRNELRKNWRKLQGLSIDKTSGDTMKIREKEQKVYDKWKFYNELIKRM